ncbi:3-isopropylmalate dehydratase small subunit [Pollutimonas bauzanensis]|uniref:3-isopropylmalate dehydratase small subunit n=1 Tax=Pollutimonas bauzanensis TaxID=658167 RepID=A0A1M5XMY3_9BURK|nr:3-isopropylmalate dehydratase small subunit [Pollutimonas bauzanensis]SHI01012.1 3-isopropylmalate/(R)-2-methylmalate dehydratase small subunit [Pollutimonas bauzanensis]
MQPFPHLDAPALPVPRSNVDTDQIVPARYLQKPRSDDFGQFLFRDLRFDKEGKENPDFMLNAPPYREARIVVAQDNFGCGSSREHAVWALHDYGFRAVIAPSFGDIFFSNALKNGLLPVVLPAAAVDHLLEMAQAEPGMRLVVDLPAQTVAAPDGAVYRFDIDAFSKKCLVEGLNEIDYTLQKADQITAFEQRYAAAHP